MTRQTSGIGLMARSAAREVGLARATGRLANGAGYEARFHDAILEERGVRNGPREVENILRAAGFVLTWTDRSHLVAYRAAE